MLIEVAKQKAGSIANLAEIFGISVQAVYKWGEAIPEQRVYELMVKRPAWFADAEAVATQNREERAESLALAAANGVAA